MTPIGKALAKAYEGARDRVSYLESWSREDDAAKERIAPHLREAIAHEITCAIALQQWDEEQRDRAEARSEQSEQRDLFA